MYVLITSKPISVRFGWQYKIASSERAYQLWSSFRTNKSFAFY